MPVGHFTEANIAPPCGLYIIDPLTNNQHTIPLDNPSEFFTPNRFNAELLWLDHGFISYHFSNKLHKKTISKLQLSFECCSEASYHRIDWPSDITVKINDIDVCTFLSPGDYGGRRGKNTPEDWFINSTQYGLLYNICIDKNGITLNNVSVSKKQSTIFHYPIVLL